MCVESEKDFIDWSNIDPRFQVPKRTELSKATDQIHSVHNQIVWKCISDNIPSNFVELRKILFKFTMSENKKNTAVWHLHKYQTDTLK